MAVIIDGDLGIDKIKDGSVVNADIASGIDAAKLTGTLPALDASSLTGIPAPAALSTASGSAPSYSARAWVNFNGQGTIAIRASGNVSSITDNGTGNYTVNFTTAMPDTNYAVSASAEQLYWSTAVGSITYTTSSVVIRVSGETAYRDVSFIGISIFR